MKIYSAALLVGLLALPADAAIDICFLRHGETSWPCRALCQMRFEFLDLGLELGDHLRG